MSDMKYFRESYRTWRVYSGENIYLVTLDSKGWHCDCIYYSVKKKICKHIKLVRDGEDIK